MKFPVRTIEAPDVHFSERPPIFQVEQPIPSRFHIRGSEEAFALLERLPEHGFAIVGTREPQQRSRSLVRKMVGDLAGSNLIIISGFARGIDAEAHEAAIENGLPTIAILGAGHGIDYPKEHQGLREKILESGGLLVSEYDFRKEAEPHQFTVRNRIIAKWAKAVWVVEASFRSGALNTAWWARESHIRCFATPCFPGDPRLAGNQRLLEMDPDNTKPLYRVSDLQAVWAEAATWPRQRRDPRAPSVEPSEAAKLAECVAVSTADAGGITVPSLLDWAMEQGWEPQRFFSALKGALNERLIEDHDGTLVANQRRDQLPLLL